MKNDPVIDTRTPAEQTNDELALAPDSNPRGALIDAMPPYLHSLAYVVTMFDPRWRGIWERESALYRSQGASDKAELLCSQVESINMRGWNRPDWSGVILEAAGSFDVDMVRELLKAGVQADQLYTCEGGTRWDIGSYALQAYMGRAQMFPNAAELWADKCAQIVALSVRAGGPSWLSIWLEPQAAPVLASRHLWGITVKGSEAWSELLAELDLPDGADVETGLIALLDKYGALTDHVPVWPGRPEAQARFEGCLDAFLDAVESSDTVESVA